GALPNDVATAIDRLVDGVELYPVQGGVVVDGPGVGGPSTEGFEVCFSCAADIVLVDRREGNQLDRVDFDPAQSNRVTAPWRHFRPAPEPERDSDLARQDVLAQLFAELHLADGTSQLCGLLPDRTQSSAGADDNRRAARDRRRAAHNPEVMGDTCA